MMNPNNPKTPGVYIAELNAFPNSVIEVATAVPAFIGYTYTARYNGVSLLNTPVKIASLVDFENIFGKGQGSTLSFVVGTPTITPAPAIMPLLNINGSQVNVQAQPGAPIFYLYNSIRLFFENGGGSCYIISVGNYSGPIQLSDFKTGLGLLKNEQEPTMVLMPDALSLSHNDYYTLVGLTLLQCQTSQSLIAILDIYGGAATSDPNAIGAGMGNDPVHDFRDNTGINALAYGVTYFPWLKTTIVQSSEITFANLQNYSSYIEQDTATQAAFMAINTDLISKAVAAIIADPYYLLPETTIALMQAHNALISLSPNYKQLIAAANSVANVLPPGPAMAGLYAYVDGSRGVWKAPANISVVAAVGTTMDINDDVQADLNVSDMDGKSVNAIRFFTGQGILVWGARTLDGNSQDWRYVNVRRTVIMIEQSVKLAARSYVFEPNTANTWLTVKTMISNFLNNLWKQGALAGSSPADAYSVSVGLGSTMTGDDILNGMMNITVLVAISRPAEFIILTFQQQMQKS
nr:phage tail sheath C-terminal domain-containing protein [uncultured Mucilaginibacter sp.]